MAEIPAFGVAEILAFGLLDASRSTDWSKRLPAQMTCYQAVIVKHFEPDLAASCIVKVGQLQRMLGLTFA